VQLGGTVLTFADPHLEVVDIRQIYDKFPDKNWSSFGQIWIQLCRRKVVHSTELPASKCCLCMDLGSSKHCLSSAACYYSSVHQLIYYSVLNIV